MRYHRSDRQYFSLRGETSVVETSRLVLPPLLLFGYLHVRSATCNIDMTFTNKEETRPTDVSTRRCVRKRVSRPLSSHFETNCPNILPTYQANSRASHGAEEFGTTPHFGSKPLAVPPVWEGGGVVHLVLWRNGICTCLAGKTLPPHLERHDHDGFKSRAATAHYSAANCCLSFIYWLVPRL